MNLERATCALIIAISLLLIAGTLLTLNLTSLLGSLP